MISDHAVAVLDGATSWLPHDPGRDGGWYARALGAALEPLLDRDDADLRDVVAHAIRDVRDRHRLRPQDSPSSTVTIARWASNALDLFVLGDSPAVIFRSSTPDPVLVSDDRLQHVGLPERETYRAHLRSGAGYDDRLPELIAALQRAERRARNRPAGHWIAEADPTAAAHAITRRVPLNDLHSPLLLTDGAAAAVTEYGLFDWATAHEAIAEHGPEAFLDRITAAEDADPDASLWPRPKCQDDKTVALVCRA